MAPLSMKNDKFLENNGSTEEFLCVMEANRENLVDRGDWDVMEFEVFHDYITNGIIQTNKVR